MPTFTMVGAAFRPAEAKEVIRQLAPGDEVTLEADPHNEYDSTAVKVIANDTFIGFVPKEENGAPFEALQDGNTIVGSVIAFEATLKPVIEYDLPEDFEQVDELGE